MKKSLVTLALTTIAMVFGTPQADAKNTGKAFDHETGLDFGTSLDLSTGIDIETGLSTGLDFDIDYDLETGLCA